MTAGYMAAGHNRRSEAERAYYQHPAIFLNRSRCYSKPIDWFDFPHTTTYRLDLVRPISWNVSDTRAIPSSSSTCWQFLSRCLCAVLAPHCVHFTFLFELHRHPDPLAATSRVLYQGGSSQQPF